MRFDSHLASYLYEYKSLRLEGIGTFTLDEKVRVPNEQEKAVYYPLEGLTFNYDPKSTTDENIIAYLVKKLAKIEPLIRSDIEYYLSNIKVLLNIGNPYTIEGIGTLIKNNHGIYEFTPGNFLPLKEELNPKRENAEHNYPVRSRNSAGRTLVVILIIISVLVLLGGAGWGIFNFISKQSASTNEGQPQSQTDTINQVTDAIAAKKDTSTQATQNTPPAVSSTSSLRGIEKPGDSATYKMIFEITKSPERAYRRTEQLNSLHSYTTYDSIPINDSVAYYRLFLPVKINPYDTTRVKDSLQKFYGKKIFMERLIEPQRH